MTIIETNSFKQINHLSLACCPGTDATVKLYLANLVTEFKQLNNSLQTQLKHTTDSLTMRVNETLDSYNQSLKTVEELKRQEEATIASLKLEHAKQLSSERDRHMLDKEAHQKELYNDRKTMEDRHERETANLDKLLSAMTAKYDACASKLTKTETNLLKAESRIESLADQLDSSKARLDSSIKESENLKSKNRQFESNHSIIIKKSEELEQKCKSLTAQNTDISSKYATTRDENMSLKESTDMVKNQAKRLEEALAKSSEEILKVQWITRAMKSSKSFKLT